MVDSGLVGIKNNPWEMGEGNWEREVGSGGVGGWKGRGRVESFSVDGGRGVGWLGDPVERLARAAGRPTTGFKNQVVCVCVCVCVLDGGRTRVFPSIFL